MAMTQIKSESEKSRGLSVNDALEKAIADLKSETLARRERAFIELPLPLYVEGNRWGPVVRMLTPLMHLILVGYENPMLSAKPMRRSEIAQFLYIISPYFKVGGGRWRYWLWLNRNWHFNAEKCREEGFKYLINTFKEKPPHVELLGDGNGRTPPPHLADGADDDYFLVELVYLFATVFFWDEWKTLNSPYLRLFQYINRHKKQMALNAGQPVFTPIGDMIKAMILNPKKFGIGCPSPKN